MIAIVCFFSTNTSSAQTIQVTVVSATDGEPLIGANVYKEDFSYSTSTDFEGKADLIDLAYRDEVVVSYIGFTEVKIPVYAIRRQNGLIKLYPDVSVDTIVVIGRRDDPEHEIPFQVQRIKKSDLKFSNAQTAADALVLNADVFVQKTQAGGGSPVIRGFEANKILLVVDGVRMNNAIYRSGHLQNSITIDNAMLEQVEVIFGPGSLTYGSDALGGVVHFRTKDPKLAVDLVPLVQSNFYTRFASANLEKSMHLDVNYGKKKWAFLSSITMVDYDALRAGNNRPNEYPDFGKRFFYPERIDGADQIRLNSDPNVQVAYGGQSDLYRWWSTGYSQIDFMQKVKIQPVKDVDLVFNYQVSSSTNVPRYDALLDTLNTNSNLKLAESYYGPQFRTFFSTKLKVTKSNPLFDKATIIGSFQRIGESRFTREITNLLRVANEEDVAVYSATADFDKYLDANHQNQFTYGVDVSHNEVNSIASSFNINTGASFLNVDTRYPSGGSSMRNYGAYGNYKWRSKTSNILFDAGVRYSSVNLEASYLTSDRIGWPEEYYDRIVSSNSDVTWATSLIYNTDSKWQLRLMAAKAFRSPNIDDWAKIRAKRNKVTVPNINLAPERAINFEATIAKEFGDYNEINKKGTSVKLSSTFFSSNLRDAIVRVDSSTLNVDVLDVNGVLYNIQTNVNAETANIRGVSANLEMKMDNHWMFQSSFNFTKGTTQFSNSVVQDTITPLAHIPPMYGRTSLSYQNKKLKLELVARYNGRKKVEDYAVSDIEADGTIDREGTSDNFEFTPSIIDENGRQTYAGSYAWTTINFYSSFKLSPKIDINLAVENIFDKHYRPFSSNISAAGRNIVVALHGHF